MPQILKKKTYTVKGTVVSKSSGKPVQYALVEIFEVDPKANDFSVDPIKTPKEIRTGKDGSFKASFSFLGIGEIEGVRPDIIFRVSQTISGVTKYIYNESPAIHTRWNIGDVVYVDLKADESAICVDPSLDKQPSGDYFIFTRVGDILVKDIRKDGYARPYPVLPVPGAINPVPSDDSNAPFGGTLSIGGWFGKKLFANPNGMVYYKIQIAEGNKSPTDPDYDKGWVDVKEPLINYRYDAAQEQWIAEIMGPISAGSTIKTENLYKPAFDTGNIPWSFPDLLIRLDTTKLKGGLHTLRVKGYRGDGNEIPTFKINPKSGLLRLELDNTLPGNPGFEPCRIISIKHISSSNVVTDLKDNECGPLPFSDGQIIVEFEASDIRGHLRNYSLNAYWGHNHLVIPTPKMPDLAVDNYKGHLTSLKWMGSYSKTSKSFVIKYWAPPIPPAKVQGDVYTEKDMPSCAYQFRLRVDKRTTNGYGLVYWGYEDNWNVFIKRK